MVTERKEKTDQGNLELAMIKLNAELESIKARKRETENKISHTKENLDRLNDVISEVLKQLRTLERQAIQADKYKKLTEEKKTIKSEILAISIRDFQEKIENKNKK